MSLSYESKFGVCIVCERVGEIESTPLNLSTKVKVSVYTQGGRKVGRG